MASYEAVMGMEVHAQVTTASKMFCRCAADYTQDTPNSHTCPICLGMPGMLPTLNRRAVEATVLLGLALNCEIPLNSKFDRKNYMYPDSPKGYQISQYDMPLAQHGWIDVPLEQGSKRIRIRRVHLEEDVAKLSHQDGMSLIDFNRAGQALMEIVTEADIRTAEEAWRYLVELRKLLRYLGIGTGNMEAGAMRCEVNLSLRPVGTEAFGTKVEIKNMNSFRAVHQAIAYEIERQTAVLQRGNKVEQVTMGWDELNHRTLFQRSKEGAEDYRYFPEPDLPPIAWQPAQIDALRVQLPELPSAKTERFINQLGLRPEVAAQLAEERPLADYFEAASAAAGDVVEPAVTANWVLTEVLAILRSSGQELAEFGVTPEHLGELLLALKKGTLNNTLAKEVLAEMAASGKSCDEVISARGLAAISDTGQLQREVESVLAANPKVVQQVREGKDQAIKFLIGQVMRQTRGQANAKMVESLLRKALQG